MYEKRIQPKFVEEKSAHLEKMVFEKLILVATRTIRALQAASKKHGDSYRNEDGENTDANHQPKRKPMHSALP